MPWDLGRLSDLELVTFLKALDDLAEQASKLNPGG